MEHKTNIKKNITDIPYWGKDTNAAIKLGLFHRLFAGTSGTYMVFDLSKWNVYSNWFKLNNLIVGNGKIFYKNNINPIQKNEVENEQIFKIKFKNSKLLNQCISLLKDQQNKKKINPNSLPSNDSESDREQKDIILNLHAKIFQQVFAKEFNINVPLYSAVIKPSFQEPYANNPNIMQWIKLWWHNTFGFMFSGQIKETIAGQAYMAETVTANLAKLLLQILHRIIVQDKAKKFEQTETKILSALQELVPETYIYKGVICGKETFTSVQRFIQNSNAQQLAHAQVKGMDKNIRGVGQYYNKANVKKLNNKNFPYCLFDLLALLAFLINHFDCHAENIFVAGKKDKHEQIEVITKIWSIDHGWSLAPKHSAIFDYFDKRNKFLWEKLVTHTNREFSLSIKSLIAELNQEKIKKLIRQSIFDHYKTIESDVNAQRRANSVLERLEMLDTAVKDKLTIRQIASIRTGANLQAFVKKQKIGIFKHSLLALSFTILSGMTTVLITGFNFLALLIIIPLTLLIAVLGTVAHNLKGKKTLNPVIRFFHSLLPFDEVAKTMFIFLNLFLLPIMGALLYGVGALAPQISTSAGLFGAIFPATSAAGLATLICISIIAALVANFVARLISFTVAKIKFNIKRYYERKALTKPYNSSYDISSEFDFLAPSENLIHYTAIVFNDKNTNDNYNDSNDNYNDFNDNYNDSNENIVVKNRDF